VLLSITGGKYSCVRLNIVIYTFYFVKTIFDFVNHARLLKEVLLPDRARWDSQVIKGRSCRIVIVLTELIKFLHTVEVSELAAVGAEVKLHSFLTLVLHGDERSALCNGYFTTGVCTCPITIE